MELHSLIAAPRNLKEGIDWLVALKGDDAENNFKAMATAVHKFLADKPVGKMELRDLEDVKSVSKEFLMQLEVHDHPYVKELLTRYNVAMDRNLGFFDRAFKDIAISDYENVLQTQSIEPETIAENLGKVVHSTEKFLDYIKRTRRYNRTYSLQATWASSCTHDPEVCAVVLVGIAPKLRASISSLNAAVFAAKLRLPPFITYKRLQQLIQALGYVEPECRAGMSGFDVSKALRGLYLRTLITLCDFTGFWAFYVSNNPDLGAGKHGNYPLSGVDFDVNMKPIDASMKIVFR